jgi:hypothetical protein
LEASSRAAEQRTRGARPKDEDHREDNHQNLEGQQRAAVAARVAVRLCVSPVSPRHARARVGLRAFMAMKLALERRPPPAGSSNTMREKKCTFSAALYVVKSTNSARVLLSTKLRPAPQRTAGAQRAARPHLSACSERRRASAVVKLNESRLISCT